MKDETKFRQNKVIPFLKRLKKTTFFPIQQSSISGTPDFLVCVNGTFVALELKSEFGELSKLQAYQLWRILNSGGVTMVAKPSNWDDIKDQLTKLDTGGIK
jgi:hypothetical protein